jgi:hypothetical protein
MVLPPIVWNIAFAGNLPLEHFPGHAPMWLLSAENVLRGATFVMPLFTAGLVTYAVGLVAYFGTWTYTMLKPESDLTHSFAHQFAPSVMPTIWFAGIAMMADSWLYGAVAASFLGFHVAEYAVLYEPVVRWSVASAG